MRVLYSEINHAGKALRSPAVTHCRVLWTEDNLTPEDRDQLRSDGWEVTGQDIPLMRGDGPGFAHSLVGKPKEQPCPR